MCQDCNQTTGDTPERSISRAAQLRAPSLKDSVAREKSAINGVVQELHSAVDQAHGLLTVFINKVEPGLSQVDKETHDDPGMPSRGSSQLCYTLEELLQAVYGLQRRIDVATSKVEL